jgi:hypothetical protein
MPAFGRRPEFDERSLDYPIRALLEPQRALQTRIWPCEPVLDQGNVGACVGFSWAHELAAEPEPVPDIDNLAGMQIYNRAQLLDQWSDTPPQEGSSVLAGAKTVTEQGHLVEYRWAFGLNDLLDTLSQFGPAVLGINWYSGMMNPDDNGYIHPTGRVVGGHAILARGLDAEQRSVLLHNSWGLEWGIDDGNAWISFEDLDQLLREDGEACIPVTRTHINIEPISPQPEPEPVEPAGCLSRQSIRSLFRKAST